MQLPEAFSLVHFRLDDDSLNSLAHTCKSEQQYAISCSLNNQYWGLRVKSLVFWLTEGQKDDLFHSLSHEKEWKRSYYLLLRRIEAGPHRLYFNASLSAHTTSVRVLLSDPDLDLEVEQGWHQTILTAGEAGHMEVVKLILADPRVYLKDDSELLAYACGTGCVPLVQLLLEDGRPDPAGKESAGLFCSLNPGPQYTEIVRLLLKDGRADPRARGSWVIGAAASSGCWDIVKLLIEDGRVDTRAYNNTALVLSRAHGKLEIEQLLSK